MVSEPGLAGNAEFGGAEPGGGAMIDNGAAAVNASWNVARQRTIQCGHSRNLAVERLSGEQHARRSTSGETRLRRGVPARAQWTVSKDGSADCARCGTVRE